ncbi:MAG: YitT family protein [Eubacteriales bacterium]|nr:YitT family protein [Eubacteriales bacterium]
MLIDYFKKVGLRRILIMLAGNVFLGIGIAVFKFSGMGNDPFSGMVMALSETVHMEYPVFLMIVNVLIFIIEFAFGRHFIGAGTLVNAFLLGYVVDFFCKLIQSQLGEAELLWQRILAVCIGVIVTSFGVALYQTPDVGIAPYDSVSLIMTERWPKIPYFFHRMSNDVIAALICYMAGGIIGLGTLLTAFCLGPFVHFFTEHFAKKLVGMKNL